MEHEAFVYLLLNTDNGRYYVGFHKGTKDDGYVCSSRNYEFWQDYNQGMEFRRYYLFFGSTEECRKREKEELAGCYNDPKCYNFANGIGGFSLKKDYIATEISTGYILEADSILEQYDNNCFIWYKREKYLELGYYGIQRDLRDARTFFGRIKLFFRQIYRRFT